MNLLPLRDRRRLASSPALSPVVVGCLLAAAATLTGCATVDPSDEEARARALIEQATGLERLEPRWHESTAPRFHVPHAGASVVPRLTIDDAVRSALANNPAILAKVAELGIAKADWVRSRWISNPSLSAAALFPSGGGTVGLGGELALELLELWRLPARREVGDFELEQAVLELAEFARQLALETRTAFVASLEAESTRKLQLRKVELTREMVDFADARFRAGAATELDQSVASTEWRRSEVTSLLAELAAKEARSELERLARTFGQELDPQLGVNPPTLRPMYELMRTAFAQRWDLRIAGLRVRELERAIDAEEWARFGLITGGVTAAREPRRPGESLELNIGPTLGLELPIFHQNQTGVAAARYAYARALHQHTALQNDIAHQVEVAHARCERYAEIATQLRDHVLVESQRRLELTRQAYEIGETTSDRVVEATRELIETERAELQARLNLVRAYDELSAATGLPHDQLGTPGPAENPNADSDVGAPPSDPLPNDTPPSNSTTPEPSATPAETGDRS